MENGSVQKLVKAFRHGKLSRRSFLKSVVAAGMSTSVAQALLVSPAFSVPKKGGRFRMGISGGSTTDTLDPSTTSSMFMISQNHATRNFLAEIGPENDLVPELAESWESNADASEWHFKLRKSVEFHNGKTMDSADVVDSINFHRSESSTSAAKALFEPIQDIKKDGANAFTVKLKSGNADFPYLFTDYHVNVLPSNGEGTIDWQSGTGTGAYVLQDFEPGVRSIATRNPNFWKEDRGHFDEVEQIVLADSNARLTALLTDEVDSIDNPELKVVGRVSSSEDIHLDNVTSWSHFSMPMHMTVAPYDNHDVRMAMKYAINREDVLNKVLKGYGTLGNDHPISPAIQYYAELEQRVYDPDRAKFHLKRANLSALNVDLSTSDGAGEGSDDIAILFKEHAREAGIDVNVISEPADGYWSNVWNKKPFCMVAWGGRATADVMFTTAYAEEAPWNDSKFSHARFNQLLKQARGETDTSLRAEMYREMQLILRDEGSAIIPAYRNWLYLRRKNIRHSGSLSANWQFDGARAAERWWFA